MRYAVKDFASGREFLQQQHVRGADCVILDVHMPHMSGLEAVRSLREAGDATPVLLVTGRSTPAIYAQAKAMGVSVLEKPMPHAVLVTAIERAIA